MLTSVLGLGCQAASLDLDQLGGAEDLTTGDPGPALDFGGPLGSTTGSAGEEGPAGTTLSIIASTSGEAVDDAETPPGLGDDSSGAGPPSSLGDGGPDVGDSTGHVAAGSTSGIHEGTGTGHVETGDEPEPSTGGDVEQPADPYPPCEVELLGLRRSCADENQVCAAIYRGLAVAYAYCGLHRCAADEDCPGAPDGSDAEATCFPYEDGTCGLSCASNRECPDGMRCVSLSSGYDVCAWSTRGEEEEDDDDDDD